MRRELNARLLAGDINAWERFLGQEAVRLVAAGATPVEAGAQAMQRVRAEWNLWFSEKNLPLTLSDPSGASGLPGGLMADGSAWMIVARPEDERSMFPAEERITPDELRQMAESYDPEFRTAAVVFPNGGPAHFTGETASWMNGRVLGLEFDGYHLWARVEDQHGLIANEVKAGDVLARSIRWWPKLPEIDGSPPYLRHLALLTGEPPGIPNMPPLAEFFQEAEAQMPPGDDERRFEELPTRARSLADLPTNSRSQTMKPKEEQKSPAPNGVPDPKGEETRDLDEVIEAAVQRAIAAALAKGEPKPDPDTPKNEGDTLRSLVEAAMKPLQEQLEAMKETEAKRTADARSESIQASLNDLVRAGRLTPVERKSFERLLATADGETVKQTIEEIERRPRILQRTDRVFDDETNESYAIPRELTAPPESGFAPASPADLKIISRASKKAREASDVKEQSRIFREEILAQCGEQQLVATVPGLN